MTKKQNLVIVGASYAGVQIAASARSRGYDGRIQLVGDERPLPYQRPPLSKGLLTGATTVDQLSLKAEAFYQENEIELLLGQTATALDPGARRVRLGDGATLDYDWLALTTGARCRRLNIPGDTLDRVITLRTLDDALRIDAAARGASSVCVIGGGFIGLELAAALRSRGLAVTVVESQPRLLARVAPPPMADFFARVHTEHGVKLLFGASVAALHGDATGQVAAVELSDGTRIACDLVVVGIGVLPNVELALQAGIACDNGVRVDEIGRSAAPGVLAAGDCASFPNPYTPVAGQAMRLESIQAANDLGRAAASVLTGNPQPYEAVPWFWSDQYDLKLQMAGLVAPGDELALRGDPAGERFSVFHLRGGRVVAAQSINRPAEHMLSRKLIAGRCAASLAQLADESFDLKTLLAGETPMAK